MNSDHRARILVVDDEPANIELLAGIFEDEHEVLFATNGKRALDLAASARPDVILLDVMMPGTDGFQVCEWLKSERATANVPVIFITGVGDTEGEARGLELGAVDYVNKPINPPVVRLRVQHQIELKRARDQLTRMAVTDGLTGLANRRQFEETLERENARLARTGDALSVILMDIDYFKPFNDTLGHVRGDDCLREVSRVLDETISRPADLAARYGGEEFGCILPETALEDAAAVAERVREAIVELGVPHPASEVADHVTASLGVATLHCQPRQSALRVVARADEQLYRAKAEGRNRVCAAESAER
ncbi:diguanylate cyclase [Thioalkalivibrio sp. ALR17-21]|uniref:diguanylate cyclase n=1 Tax=Thioalkalivibrio sp. ALR17-21 TaxID=1269813 RepID=UPI0004115BD5|nr:diguanylate cyclase [Thioalkalivibrio sp. ALR17-21]